MMSCARPLARLTRSAPAASFLLPVFRQHTVACSRISVVTKASSSLHRASLSTGPRCGLLSPAGDPDNLSRRIPSLMDLPEVVYPKLTHTLRNWFFAHALITPYFDVEFSLSEFVEGAKQAVQVISTHLASGDLVDIEKSGVMDVKCLEVLRKNLSLFTAEQRRALKITTDDIYLAFVYQVGIILGDEQEEEGKASTRHVEITAVFHAMPGFKDVAKEADGPGDIKEALEKRGGPIILNYRFIRDFTKGVEDDWTVNAVNHFYMTEKDS